VEQRDRDPGVLAGDLGRGVALQGERKGKGEAADLWACGSVTERARAGRGARTRAPCCCMRRLRRLGARERASNGAGLAERGRERRAGRVGAGRAEACWPAMWDHAVREGA